MGKKMEKESRRRKWSKLEEKEEVTEDEKEEKRMKGKIEKE